jgi:hypothetical protein
MGKICLSIVCTCIFIGVEIVHGFKIQRIRSWQEDIRETETKQNGPRTAFNRQLLDKISVYSPRVADSGDRNRTMKAVSLWTSFVKVLSILKYKFVAALFLLLKVLLGSKGTTRSLGYKLRSTKDRNVSYVYVLECENGCFYVGSTKDIVSRWEEHTSTRGGSKWTSIYKPLRISHIEEVSNEHMTGLELRLTAEHMLEHGVNRVRGAMWCGVQAFDSTSIPMLHSVIAHILGLNYKEVELKLLRQLKESPNILPSSSLKTTGLKRKKTEPHMKYNMNSSIRKGKMTPSHKRSANEVPLSSDMKPAANAISSGNADITQSPTLSDQSIEEKASKEINSLNEELQRGEKDISTTKLHWRKSLDSHLSKSTTGSSSS